MRHFSIILLSVAFLTACAPIYSDTLEQKLAGKSPDQQRAMLAQECSQEIKAGLKTQGEANVQHFERMRKICEEMTGQSISIEATALKK